MADAKRNNGMAAVAELEAQQAALQTELRKLAADMRPADILRGGDTAANKHARRSAIEAALQALEADMAAARAAAAAEQAGAAAVAAAAQRETAWAALDAALVDLAAQLPAIETLAATVATAAADVRRAGGYVRPEAQAGAGLQAACAAVRAAFGRTNEGRALVNLPARPSEQDRIVSEARAQIARLEGLLADMKQRAAMPVTADSEGARRAAQDRVTELSLALALERGRLAQLTGGIVGDLRRAVENIALSLTDESAYSGKSLEDVERLRVEREQRAGRRYGSGESAAAA